MTRHVSYQGVGLNGRFANCLWQIASTVGLAERRGAVPVFDPRDWVYRPVLSMPEVWWPEKVPKDAVPSVRLVPHLSVFAATYLQDLSLWWPHAAESVFSAFALAVEAASVLRARFEVLVRDVDVSDVCVVHVRRGDTVTRNPPGTINPLPVSFFRRAVASTGCSSVLVFSDDPVWCEAMLPRSWRVVVAGLPGPEDHEPDYATRHRSDWLDLYLMAELVRRGAWMVLSNSSFAWWAAVLGGALEHERVVVPARWYGPRLARKVNADLMLPAGWHRM